MHENYVQLGEKVFKQKKGTATGTAVAPAFANLHIFFKFRAIFRGYVGKVISNRRYIDNGFVILRDKDAAQKLMRDLGNASCLSLTWELSDLDAIYLDLRIYKGHKFEEAGILDLTVHTKPISKFLYLHRQSNHAEHVTTGIIKGELIRYLRNTSSERLWTLRVVRFFRMLTHREYSGKQAREALRYVSYKDRPKYLGTWDTPSFDPGNFVVAKYHRHAKNCWTKVTRWILLKNQNPLLKEKWPDRLIFKQGATIGRKSIRATQHPPC